MGVETSNTDMFTINDAIGLLVAAKGGLSESEINMWRNKGSDAILAEVARLNTAKVVAATPVAIDPVAEEEAAPKTRGKKSGE